MENITSDYSFREGVAAALQRRIGPAMPITYKHVAQATGFHPQTVRAWCERNQRIPDCAIGELIKLFGPSFYNEIYAHTGCVLIRMEDLQKAKALQAAVALIERAAGGV